MRSSGNVGPVNIYQFLTCVLALTGDLGLGENAEVVRNMDHTFRSLFPVTVCFNGI
jgi:hypothetical protein